MPHKSITRAWSLVSFSPVSLCAIVVGVLITTYIGLIAVVMSYGAFTIEFSQSVRNAQAAVATLEEEYLTAESHISIADYSALGYEKPLREFFVQEISGTARR